MISLCSGVTLVEIISVFGCFFKINTSLVFHNRGAGLARNRLRGRPNEGGRNTKAKLAVKQAFIFCFFRVGMLCFGATGATFNLSALFISFFKINRSDKYATCCTFVTPAEKGKIQC